MSRELSGKVAGSYRLGDPLARGSASTVYAAEQTDTGRAVAVRVFSVDLSKDKAAAAKLVSEVARLTAVRHPNIVSVLDVGTVENKGKKYLYVAMERLHGESLKARLSAQAGRALPLHVALQIASEVGGALQAIHRAGLCHQRVAAGSIFLAAPSDEERRSDPDAEDRVVLLDLGTALALGASETGKPARPAKPQDDVRCLALLVQEMLGGAGEPAKGEAKGEIPGAAQGATQGTTQGTTKTDDDGGGEHPLLPLRFHNRKVPARVDAVLRTALGEPAFAESSRNERLDSPAALVAALLGAPDATPALGAWSADGRAAMPRPRTGTSWLWAGGLALVGGLGVGYWLYQSDQPVGPAAAADLSAPAPAPDLLMPPAPDLAAPPRVDAALPTARQQARFPIPPLRDAAAPAIPPKPAAPTGLAKPAAATPAAAPAGSATSAPSAPAAPAAAPAANKPTAPATTPATSTPAPGAPSPKPAGPPTRANEVK